MLFYLVISSLPRLAVVFGAGWTLDSGLDSRWSLPRT